MQVEIEESETTMPSSSAGHNADEDVVSTRVSGKAPAIRGVADEEIVVGRLGGVSRPLKDSSRKMIEALAAPDVEAEADALETPAGDAPAEAKPVAEPHPDTARADRLTESNRRLAAENAELRAKPTRAELTAREKALHDAERAYFDDPLAAHRRLIAAAHGTEDVASKDVEAELEALLEELTSKKIGVPLTREAEDGRKVRRALAALERDKRETKAAAATPAPEAKPDQDAAVIGRMAEVIGGELGAEHPTKYPLLHALADDPLIGHGMKPNVLLAAAIKEGLATGELDSKSSNADLIDYASKHFDTLYETRYQALAEKYRKAKPRTAEQPAAATESNGKNAGPAGKTSRTITSASASAAPATPPAKKSPASKGPPSRADYRSESAFRAAAIAYRTGSAG